jgi:hypothetical protein
VTVVDELSKRLVRDGLIERGDIRFNYDLHTQVLTVVFPNKRTFLCGIEDDDPDQLTCYPGFPMKPYRTMSEGVAVNLIASVNLLSYVSTQKALMIHTSCLHPLSLDAAGRLAWQDGGHWESVSDKSGSWIMLRTSTN